MKAAGLDKIAEEALQAIGAVQPQLMIHVYITCFIIPFSLFFLVSLIEILNRDMAKTKVGKRARAKSAINEVVTLECTIHLSK